VTSSLADTMQRSAAGRCVAGIYAQLAQKFQGLVDALNEVTNVVPTQRRRYLAALRDLDENRQRARHALLRQLGVQPVSALERAGSTDAMVLRGLQSLAAQAFTTSSPITTFMIFW